MKKAVFVFSQQIKTHPGEALHYLNRGSIYAILGLFPDAITDYNKAIKIDPDFAEAYYNRPDKKENILTPVDIQCQWLRDIGFQDVDCFLKIFELALFGGRKTSKELDVGERV